MQNLEPGSLVLGRVAAITAQDLALALPNNLHGYVPVTAISDQLSQRVQKFVDQDAASDASDALGSEDVHLSRAFAVGQYLRACVTDLSQKTVGREAAKTKTRIGLSIHPKATNRGMLKSSAVLNAVIQASVSSNEDHGLVMDLGVASLKGFLPAHELPPGVHHAQVDEGAVFLCLVTAVHSSRRVVTLSASPRALGDAQHVLKSSPTVNVLVPGVAAEMLVTEVAASTVTGTVMGMLDATADLLHSGATERQDHLKQRLQPASKVRVRILYMFPDSQPQKVGVSLLGHMLSLSQEDRPGHSLLPLSSFVEAAKVVRVEPAFGLLMDLGANRMGLAHISRISDQTVRLSGDSGAYQVGSQHRARVVAYNSVDGLFQLSLDPKVLDQPFLRVEDVQVGQVVHGHVESVFVDKSGVAAVQVRLADDVAGVASELHLADTPLSDPSRKFRKGMPVTARVLATDVEKRHVRLTLKKSLVQSEAAPWTTYSRVVKGAVVPGTVANLKPTGAVVQFYGDVRGWLPASHMSEAYVANPSRCFRRGQVVRVHALTVEPELGRMTVSCKDPQTNDVAVKAFAELSAGALVTAKVVEKLDDKLVLELDHGVKGVLAKGHLTDGSEKKDASAMGSVRVGATLKGVVVLDKFPTQRLAVLSVKPSLCRDAQAGTLVTRLAAVAKGQSLNGFVHAITPNEVFVEFGAGLCGVLYKPELTPGLRPLPDFGLRRNESVTVRVTFVDPVRERFGLSMKPDLAVENAAAEAAVQLANPVDPAVAAMGDLTFGTKTRVRITDVAKGHLDVRVADGVSGTVCVAEAFDDWDRIEDKQHPLAQFHVGQEIPATVLGAHDARNHRCVPLTTGVPCFEFTARSAALARQDDVLTLDKMAPGTSWVAFVNNFRRGRVWVSLSANVRGQMDILDLADDASLVLHAEQHFPIGSALRVRVKSVDVRAGRLDLSAKSAPLTWDSLQTGQVHLGRVTKSTQTAIVVHLQDGMAAMIHGEHLADDFSRANPKAYKVGELMEVCVVQVDADRKTLALSARPSRVRGGVPVQDAEITSKSDLTPQQVVRGFVEWPVERGLFVRIGLGVKAFVPLQDLSDSRLDRWQEHFPHGRLVTGKIMAIDPKARNPRMSLKRSHLDGRDSIDFGSLQVGQIVTCVVRRVEDFGVVLAVQKSKLTGVCYREEIADGPVTDLGALYKPGDRVRAKVTKLDADKQRVTFGLKFSYLQDAEPASEPDASGGDEASSSDEAGADDALLDRSEQSDGEAGAGLRTAGFDWAADAGMEEESEASASSVAPTKPKKKRRKPEIHVDHTGDLDVHGPQSVADYERLLLGQPNAAELWVRYMVFQRGLNEIDKARQIGRRALRTMHPREDRERRDVWTALLHLENEFGADSAVADVFQEACQYNDAQEIHDRMAKIYITSGKLEVCAASTSALAKLHRKRTRCTSPWRRTRR